MHASPIAINDKLQSLCPLSLCPNYCLYAVTVGVADGSVVLLFLLLHYYFIFFNIEYNYVLSCSTFSRSEVIRLYLGGDNLNHLLLFCVFSCIV